MKYAYGNLNGKSETARPRGRPGHRWGIDNGEVMEMMF
jgi:hypothetical protein